MLGLCLLHCVGCVVDKPYFLSNHCLVNLEQLTRMIFLVCAYIVLQILVCMMSVISKYSFSLLLRVVICDNHETMENISFLSHNYQNTKLLQLKFLRLYTFNRTQADIFHVKFTLIELHVKFTWNSLNTNFVWTFRVNFTWRLHSLEFHVNSVS